MEFLGHCRAAHHIAPFDDAYLQPGLRKVECADEAVMASADDHSVVFPGHAWLRPTGRDVIAKPYPINSRTNGIRPV